MRARIIYLMGVCVVLSTGGMLFTLPFANGDPDEDERHAAREGPSFSGLRSMPQVTNGTWKEECGSCHMLYHPSLLPERSWRSIMSSLDKHFGEDASLEPAPRQVILNFLLGNSADKNLSPRAAKINRSIPFSETPVRITDTSYFKRKHDEISNQTWKRSAIGGPARCTACHGAAAEQGIFNEERVKIPKGP